MGIPRPVVGLWLFAAALAAIHLARPDGAAGDATYLVGVVGAPLIGWLGVARAPAGQRLVPVLIATGLAASGLGDTLYVVYQHAGLDPDVSLPDIPYFASYLALGAAALVTSVRPDGSRVDVGAVLDALTVVIVSVLVLWTVTIEHIAGDRTVGLWSRVVLSAYPVLDAVLLALALRALWSRRGRRALGLPYAAGITGWLAADLGYLLLPVSDRTTAYLDAGFILSAGLTAAVAWRRPTSSGESASGPPALASLGQLLVAIVPLAAPTVILFVNHVRGRDEHESGPLLAMLLLLAVAFVRTWRLLRSERRARADLAEARDVALAASQAKSAFLATMSHEIRTPLNGVLGLNELLLTTRLDEQQLQYAEGVRRSGQVLLDVINEVLDFSRIESGHLELEELDVDLARLLEDVAGVVSEPAQAKRLELLAYCSPEVPTTLRGDPGRLRQVLLNLAGNAVKFTAAGEVLVRAELESRTEDTAIVRFAITDSGIGIAEENLSRLFEPFAQGDASTTRRFGGSGLGLAICRQLVEAMSGTIGVDSTPGSGSTFWFTVPLRVGPAGAAVVRPPTGLAGLRALVVDDSKSHLAVLNDQLQHWGMSVDVADGSHRALLRMRQALRQGRGYDVALVDVVMPDVDGLELARWIAEDRTLSRTPVVLMTSGPDAAAPDPRMASAAAVLTKPVPVSRLREALVRVVPDRVPDQVVVDRRPALTEARGHVLVVDDGDVNRMVAVGVLNLLGYSTVAVEGGRQALAVLRDGAFDAVLMDVAMPGMDGYQATRALRSAEDPDHRVPVIAMTAIVADGERERCLEAGMDDYLTKPLTRTALTAAMDRWVAGARAGS